MYNNRLFYKFNSLFWGILSWAPIFLILYLIIAYSFSVELTSGNFETYYDNIIATIFDNVQAFENPLYNYFNNFLGLFNLDLTTLYWLSFISLCASWFCFIQLIHLLVYVFAWFIELIKSLFDLISFNKKGDL